MAHAEAPDERWISAREFARRDGCNEALVRRALGQGKLAKNADGKMDATLVGTPWRMGNIDAAPASAGIAYSPAEGSTQESNRSKSDADTGPFSGDPALPSYGTSQQRKEAALAEMRQIELAKMREDLVEIELARRVVFGAIRTIRDAWMNFPSSAGPRIAAELDVPPERVFEVLDAHVREHLATISESPALDFKRAP